MLLSFTNSTTMLCCTQQLLPPERQCSHWAIQLTLKLQQQAHSACQLNYAPLADTPGDMAEDHPGLFADTISRSTFATL